MDLSALARLGLLISLLAPFAGHACDLAGDAECSDSRIEATVTQSGEVFASKGGAVVTNNDIDAYLEERVLPEHYSPFLMDPDRIGDMLRNLVTPLQLARRAIDDGLHMRPETQALLVQALSNVLANEYAEFYAESQQLDDYEPIARELFLRSERQSSEKLDFTQLLISTDQTALLDAMREIVEIADRLEADPSVFDELVAAHSDDPALEQNEGAYRDVPPAQIVDPVRTALLELKPGELSGVVQSQFGLHILRLDAQEPRKAVEFEEVRDEMLERARAQHRDLVMGNLMSELDRSDLQIRENAVRDLLERYDSGFGIFDRAE